VHKHSLSWDTNVTWEHEFQNPHDLNVRGVFLHILEHFLSSIIVIISALIVMTLDGHWVPYVDPSLTLIVISSIVYSIIPLFKESIMLFMQTVPTNLTVKEMEERLIKAIPKVLALHEFHVWQLGGDHLVGPVHLVFRNAEDYEESADNIKMFFSDEGIQCMTFQPEFLGVSSEETVTADLVNECHLPCNKGIECTGPRCCQTHVVSECRGAHGPQETL